MVNRWTQNMQLDPAAQAALDDQQALTAARSSQALGMYDRVGEEFSDIVNFDNYIPMGSPVEANNYDTYGMRDYGDIGNPADFRTAAEDATYNRFTSRLDPQFSQRAEALEAQLRAQGLNPGDQAYDNAMGDFERERTDAYAQASYMANEAGRAEAGQMFDQSAFRAGFSNDTRAQQISDMLRVGGANFDEAREASGFNTTMRQQQIAEEMQRRGYTLNEINALLTGQQVATPGMPEFNTANRSETPQYMSAAQNQYAAELDSFNAGNAALQGMLAGGASIGSAFMPF